MQIVIEIDELVYIGCKVIASSKEGRVLEETIADGTPLPKGHGRLIDADDFFRMFCELDIEPYNNAPTIIEADGGENL